MQDITLIIVVVVGLAFLVIGFIFSIVEVLMSKMHPISQILVCIFILITTGLAIYGYTYLVSNGVPINL